MRNSSAMARSGRRSVSRSLLAVPHRPSRAIPDGFIDRIAALVEDAAAPAGQADLVAIVEAALANFRHRGTARTLDERL